MSKIDKAVNWMIDLANNPKHGYDQQYRWGERGDYDCSAAVITAWQTAGVPVKSYGATYTGNMYNAFIKAGFKDVTRSVNLRTGSGLIRGDVLLNTSHHTALYIGNGQLAQASINEKGTARGGKPGDQTGRETNISRYYNYPWNVVLRYPETQTSTQSNSLTSVARAVIAGKYGNGDLRRQNLKKAGYDYNAVQAEVNRLLKGGSAKKDVTTVAREVIAGKWGNGATRKQKLQNAGYDYNAVQRKVNELLR